MSLHVTRERRALIRGRVRLSRSDCKRRGDRVVRVPLGMYGRTHAYVVREPVRLGDRVEVHARVSGWTTTYVVAFGRGGWQGRLKRGRVLR